MNTPTIPKKQFLYKHPLRAKIGDFMSIKNWPETDKPKEKLFKLGANKLSDAELIAVILNTGTKEKNVLTIARELLSHFGNIRQIINSPFASITTQSGIGKHKYILLQAAVELGKRHMNTHLQPGDLFTSPNDVKLFLTTKLRDYSTEVFAAIFLNNRHRLICFEELAHGTINQAAIYPREIIKKALELNASAMILAHNHPSGHCEPSESDKAITIQLKTALGHLDINVLDHFIVGDKMVFSFREHGLI